MSLTDDVYAEAWLREFITGELTGSTSAQLRALAEQHLRVRDALLRTMPDLDQWAGEHGAIGVPELTAYIDHLSWAHQGTCEICHRLIFAPHRTTAMPVRPAWHPHRWWQALTLAGRGIAAGGKHLRYGGDPIAHTSCLPRQHWT